MGEGKLQPEETIGQHLWWPNNMRDHIYKLCKDLPSMPTQQKKKEIWVTPTKRAEATP
jgi:hypothetical protein